MDGAPSASMSSTTMALHNLTEQLTTACPVLRPRSVARRTSRALGRRFESNRRSPPTDCVRPVNTLIGRHLPDSNGVQLKAVDVYAPTTGTKELRFARRLAAQGEFGGLIRGWDALAEVGNRCQQLTDGGGASVGLSTSASCAPAMHI